MDIGDIVFFLFKDSFIYLKGRVTQRDSQLAPMARDGPDQTQDCGNPNRPATWVAVAQLFESSVALPGASTGKWIRTELWGSNEELIWGMIVASSGLVCSATR